MVDGGKHVVVEFSDVQGNPTWTLLASPDGLIYPATAGFLPPPRCPACGHGDTEPMSTDEQGRDRCCPACRYSFASVASLERADAPDFADIAAFAVDGDGVVAYSPRVAAQANFWLREAWRQCRG